MAGHVAGPRRLLEVRHGHDSGRSFHVCEPRNGIGTRWLVELKLDISPRARGIWKLAGMWGRLSGKTSGGGWRLLEVGF